MTPPQYNARSKLLRPAPLIAVAILLIAILIVLFNILVLTSFHLPYFHSDDWNLYEDYLNFGIKEFTFQRFILHPYIFPKLFFIFDIYLFSGKTAPFSYFALLVNAGIALSLSYLLWKSRTEQTSPVFPAAACALIFASVFWFVRDYEFAKVNGLAYPWVFGGMLLAGWGLLMHLTRTRDLCPHHDRWLLLTALGCAIATLSFGTGGVTWPAVAMIMLLFNLPVRRVMTFLAMGVPVVLIPFFLPDPRVDLGIDLILKMVPGVWEALSYFPVFLGTALNYSLFDIRGTIFTPRGPGFPAVTGGIAVSGVLVLIVYSWIQYRRGSVRSVVVAMPLFFAWFAVFAAALATITRGGLDGGFGNPNAGRYASWSAMLWIGLLWIGLYESLRDPRPRRGTWSFLTLAVLAVSVFTLASFHGINHLLGQSRQVRLGGLSMVVAPEKRFDDIWKYLRHGEEAIRRIRPKAREAGHNMFADPWTRRLGDEWSEHYQLVDGAECGGRWQRLESRREGNTRVYEGWALGPHGSFETLLLVADEILVGGAKPVWLGDPRRALGETARAPSRFPYFLGTLVGHNPGWLGVADMSQGPPGARLRVYGALGADAVCRISRRDDAHLPEE